MSSHNAGKLPGPALPAAGRCTYVPRHYIRRLARSIVLRAALRGRLSWHVAIPVMNRLDIPTPAPEASHNHEGGAA